MEVTGHDLWYYTWAEFTGLFLPRFAPLELAYKIPTPTENITSRYERFDQTIREWGQLEDERMRDYIQ